jgi:hypothetical protein
MGGSDVDSPSQHSDDANTSGDDENPKKRPNFWHNTLRDVIKRQSSRGKSK